MSVRAMFRSPQRTKARPSADSRDELLERGEEAHLGREILAAVRHVDRRDVIAGSVDRARCGSRSRSRDVRNAGRSGDRLLLTCSADARVAFRAVPVTPVAVHLANAAGTWSCDALISCRHTTSGCSRAIHSCTWA